MGADLGLNGEVAGREAVGLNPNDAPHGFGVVATAATTVSVREAAVLVAASGTVTARASEEFAAPNADTGAGAATAAGAGAATAAGAGAATAAGAGAGAGAGAATAAGAGTGAGAGAAAAGGEFINAAALLVALAFDKTEGDAAACGLLSCMRRMAAARAHRPMPLMAASDMLCTKGNQRNVSINATAREGRRSDGRTQRAGARPPIRRWSYE